MAAFTDTELYERMLASLLSSWRPIAAGSPHATVTEVPGAAIAVFPAGPERVYYNNSVLARGLDRGEAAATADAVAEAYWEAGVERYAVWAHEADEPANAELASRGYRIDTTTRAMAMPLTEIAVARPEIELGPPDWSEYLRLMELPPGTLADVDPEAFHVRVARLGGENVAAGLSHDRAGDCGIFNLGTLAPARRRGLGTALTALLVHDARDRGCTTASLQATDMGERIYASVGFRDLGRFIEYMP
jgi:ribosomal protein S18 acetylase RimI-like enzyme